ncbi:uncharacterized protein Z520_10547 [Fonsecaea multimorphosa CBS 102226]|uniref:Ras modification protein ERF4 n=1 Tax=Fonsecaea multimorphosa CBS 102226 TaxID=1442371 RepID=A0A0D2I8X6_9EURO|nr:uncharacterized protein Z520_10547 [Fonsecaea multimorphosa CBS 102226]KIX93641.1 hypothetical protein Z520_10547 [Fonsecaea multimorphosa CBS 102226]
MVRSGSNLVKPGWKVREADSGGMEAWWHKGQYNRAKGYGIVSSQPVVGHQEEWIPLCLCLDVLLLQDPTLKTRFKRPPTAASISTKHPGARTTRTTPPTRNTPVPRPFPPPIHAHVAATAAAAAAPSTINTTINTTTNTTEPASFDHSHLSPRALEKQPARDAPGLTPKTHHPHPPISDPRSLTSSYAEPAPPADYLLYQQKPLPPPPAPSQAPSSYRRSFLEALLPRQSPKRTIPPDNRSAASRVLNPINHVPRPTPVRVQPQRPQLSTDVGAGARGTGEVHTLLSLPEQRRSRQHSPTDPIVEHSPHLTPTGDRTSIGLPSNQQRGNNFLPESSSRGVGLMVDLEKQDPSDLKPPERAHTVPTSKYNVDNASTQQGPSVLGQSYGVNPLDQPLQPPRRITSHKSLKRAQSAASIHSSAFGGRAYTDSGHPPNTASLEDVERGAANGDEDSDVAEELAWGPSHPCFPHYNPHVPLHSREYAATRIIRIRRDWMVVGDLAPTFSNIYPEILDPLMQEQEFRYVIEHINQTLCQAYDPFSAWNWFDGIMGVLTGWFWEDFRPWGIKGALRGLEEWLEDWNHTVGARDGVKIIPLRRTGYMNLDIQIPDPQVRVVGEDGESQGPRPNTQGTGTATVPPQSATAGATSKAR